MPKIPIYEEHVELMPQGPNVEVDTRTYGVQGRAVAGMWQGVGKAGEDLAAAGFQINRALRHAGQVTELANAQIAAQEQLFNLRDQVKEYEDPKTWVDGFKQSAREYYENALGNISDPLVQAHFKRHWASIYPVKLQGVMKDARNRQIANFAGDVETNFAKSVELYARADNDLERTRIEADLHGLLSGGMQAGYLAPAKAEQLKQRFAQQVRVGRAEQDAMRDPFAFKARIGEYGLDAGETDQAIAFADRQIHRLQNETYSGYMKTILGQVGDASGDTSQLPPLEQVKGDIEAGRIDPRHGRDVLAYVQGVKGNPQQKTDPQSYKEAVTRLTDPDDPLTREEFLKNVEEGDWKFDARTYGQFLVNIGSRGAKLEKAAESAFKARIAFWKTQFGMDPKGDQIMTALGQAQVAKDAGELGSTPEEIQKNLDAIFAPQHKLYMQEWGLGSFKPQPRAKQSWWERVWGGRTGSAAGPASRGAPETVTKNGRRYRVLTINGQKMVDTTPLP